MNFNIQRFDSIDSTNSEALKHARQGADEGLCVIARQQTAGRGRLGRTWSSPIDAGLYLSIVLRPDLISKSLPLITLAAAVAVFDSLTEIGLVPDIKWPNDVLVDEKKICGILAETTETRSGLAVVLGIGVNAASESFPRELAETATSVEDELGRPFKPSDLEPTLLRQSNGWYSCLCGRKGDADVIDAWQSRSTYARGKLVQVTLAGDGFAGKTDGLESDGAMRVVSADGSLTIVHAGDVRRLRPNE